MKQIELTQARRIKPIEERGRIILAATLIAVTVSSSSPAHGDVDIAILNPSFESPTTFFAYPDATDWDETGPISEDPQLPGVIDTLDTGVFFNSPVDGMGMPSPFYIPNADGMQLGFIGAVDDTDIAYFQELDAPYEVGAKYTLLLDVGTSSFLPPRIFSSSDPPLLAVRLYYDESPSSRVVVAERLISLVEMPENTDLIEFASTTGFLGASSNAIGESVGVEIRPFAGEFGNWNLDNARLSADCGTGTAFGDVDADGDIDLSDYSVVAECFTGPENGPAPVTCPPCAFERSDSDLDGDVDLSDVAQFVMGFTG